MDESYDNTVKSSDEVDGRQSSTNMCKPCNRKKINKTADYYCKNCNEFQCSECSKCHDMFEMLVGHELVDATKGEKLIPAINMKEFDTCHSHKERFKLYCVDHDTLCCTMCVCTQHRTCKEVNELSQEARKANINVSILSELDEPVNEAVKFLEDTKASIKDDLGAVVDKIEKMKQSVIKKFDDIKASVSDEITQTKLKISTDLDAKLSVTRGIGNEIAEYKQKFTPVFENGSDEEKFIISCMLKQQRVSYRTSLKESTKSFDHPKYSYKSDALTQLLQAVDVLATPHLETYHSDTPQLAPDVLSGPVRLELVKSVKVRQRRGDGFVPFYTGLDFLPDGRLVLVDNKNKMLKVINDGLEILETFKFVNHPCDVAVISQEEVAVSGDGIEILHISKTNTITLTRTIKTTVKYFSICLMNPTTLLGSTYEDKRPMRMITLTGNEKDFNRLYNKRYNFDASRSAYLHSSNTLVLTDRYLNTVFMYDSNDEGSTKYVVKDSSIQAPIGVCEGPNGSLFVCCKGSHSLVHISSSGKVLGSHVLDMEYPVVVCMSSDGKKLVVSSSSAVNRELHLFNILSE